MDQLTEVHNMLRDELNNCLSREAWSESAKFQELIMLVLGHLNGTRPLELRVEIQLYQTLGDRLERRANQQSVRAEGLIANRYQRYANRLREISASLPG